MKKNTTSKSSQNKPLAELTDAEIFDQSNRERVLNALDILLHNPETPADLYEAVAQFVCTQTNKSDFDWHSYQVLTCVLDSVQPKDLRGAVIAKHEAKSRVAQQIKKHVQDYAGGAA